MNQYTCLNPGDGPCGACLGCLRSRPHTGEGWAEPSGDPTPEAIARSVIIPPAEWARHDNLRNLRLYEILYLDEAHYLPDEEANKLWYLLAAPPSRWQRIKQAVRGYFRRRLGRASRPYGYWMDVRVHNDDAE